MYLHEYHEPGLGSLRKKLRKVGKIAAHVGAAVATGGASLAVSAAMINAKKQRAAQARAAAEAAAQEQALLRQITETQTQPTIAPAVVTPSAGGTMPTTIAPAVWKTESGDQPMSAEQPGGAKPAWLMPAALVGGGLLLATMLRGSRR